MVFYFILCVVCVFQTIYIIKEREAVMQLKSIGGVGNAHIFFSSSTIAVEKKTCRVWHLFFLVQIHKKEHSFKKQKMFKNKRYFKGRGSHGFSPLKKTGKKRLHLRRLNWKTPTTPFPNMWKKTKGKKSTQRKIGRTEPHKMSPECHGTQSLLKQLDYWCPRP